MQPLHMARLNDPSQAENQHITQASTCVISPLLSEFIMETQSTSKEENALKGCLITDVAPWSKSEMDEENWNYMGAWMFQHFVESKKAPRH